MKFIYVFTLILSCILLFSCGSSEKKSTAIPLEETAWKLYQMGGKAYSSENKVTINFKGTEHKVTGVAPCNNYFGTYVNGGEILTFGTLSSTRKACPDLETESKYLNLLQSTSTFHIHGTELNLYDSSGKIILIFTSK